MDFRIRARGVWCLLVAAALLAGPPDAHAVFSCLTDEIGIRVGDAPFLCGLANGRASSPGSVGTPSTMQGSAILGLGEGGVDIAVVAAGGIGAMADGITAFGFLEASAEATAGDFTEPTGLPTAESYAQAEVAFGDRIVLTSNDLPNGAPVAITAIVSVSGAFGANGGAGLLSFYVGNAGSFVDRRQILLVNANPSFHEEVPLSPRVGDEIFLRLGIRAAAGAVDGPMPSSGFAEIFPGEILLRAETPGVEFQSASGHSYVVPEAGGEALALAVLLLVHELRRAAGATSATSPHRAASGAST
jgi:hypothetical protein